MHLMILQISQKNYKIESIYMEVFILIFIFCSNSYEKILKTHRILENTSVLKYTLVTPIKAAGNRDH